MKFVVFFFINKSFFHFFNLLLCCNSLHFDCFALTMMRELYVLSCWGVKATQPELLDEAFGMLRDQAENATVSFSFSCFNFVCFSSFLWNFH